MSYLPRSLAPLLCLLLAPAVCAQDPALQLKITSPEPKKDARTGFIVGGKNETALIRTLTEINGVPLAKLEKAMRPGANSTIGFLGKEENLLDVLAADNDLVVGELGLTHQELARHLRILAAIGEKTPKDFTYLGKKFQVKVVAARGFIDSPFADGIKTNQDATVVNVATGKKVSFSYLVPLMIERYGFYEGKGTTYRVDPRRVVEVLELGKPKADQN